MAVGSMALNALSQFRTSSPAMPQAAKESQLCSCGLAVEGRLGPAYNEEAFRYFLRADQKRAEASGRPFLLLLVNLKKRPGESTRVEPSIAGRIFEGLSLCLRDTDLIGWFREERTAAAVLHVAEGPTPEASRQLATRVTANLCAGLTADVARRLRVRVHRLPRRVQQ
jgi:hypothetical protein